MPTYVYECRACGTTFEAEQRITEDPLTTCVCGAEGTVKRVIQPIAVMFKGAGFHINDYAPSTSAPKPETATGSEAKTEGTTSTKESAPSTPGSAPTTPTEPSSTTAA